MGTATILAIVVTVLGTSFLSGIFGMVGGVILLAVLLLFLPVPAAMSLHAVTQATANGWRVVLWRRYVIWRIMPTYFLGSLLAFGFLTWLSFQPPTAWVYVALGIIPFLALLVPARLAPDIRRPFAPFCLGMLIMGIHVIAGVSGALLDIFFFRTDLDRRQIVATKACSQTLGHLMKLSYFLIVGNASEIANDVPLWIFGISVATAMTGTSLARYIVEALSNRAFQLWTRWLAAGVAVICLWRGVVMLMG